MTTIAKQMENLIKLGKFEEAYDLGKDPLSDPSSYPDIMQALNSLGNELRFYCMHMTARKMDFGNEYDSREGLLRSVSSLIGKDIYDQRL
ncbi:MAG TPA: hypothetical protein VEY92_07285 [Pseudoxanthomonas sp.]|nr:hypothetical protein [Pseudoxanthomonas sp.]